MRVSREVMAEHHDEIVTAASKMLRERGVDRTSLADLMQEVGMTHGGFYRHFKSKDALVAQSTEQAFDEIIAAFDEQAKKEGPKAALVSYVEDYLSGEHIDWPADGCPVATYGADAAREGPLVRTAFSNGIRRVLELVSAGLSCAKEQRRARAIELTSMLSGAIVMARSSGDQKLAKEILRSARERAREIIDAKR
jgi:TetR/AcrR family transcriptional regulator, transcriptional repressor for nem operon